MMKHVQHDVRIQEDHLAITYKSVRAHSYETDNSWPEFHDQFQGIIELVIRRIEVR